MKPHEGRKRRFGDRYDGFKVRNLDPMGLLIPYIMQKKVDSWVLFEAKIDIADTEKFIREKRQGDIPDLTFYHIVYAALMRAFVEVPEMNRFVRNSKIYSRNKIKGSMVVMRGMKRDSERSMIMPEFDCDDTLYKVVERINEELATIDKNLSVKEQNGKDGNGLDGLMVILQALPSFIIRGFVNFMSFLDNHGWMPKIINKLSPFHASFFITNMGSIGLDAVYHHVYEFGTLSLFTSIGKKEVVYEPDAKGVLKRKVYVKMQTVVDERATDGFIYTLGFKALKKYITHPELLLTPPEKVVFDVID